MSGPYALGAALYFDTELFADPKPFATIVEALFGVASPDGGAFTQWSHRVDGHRTGPPKPYKLATLLAGIATGARNNAAVESRPPTRDTDHMLVYAATGPAATLPAPYPPTSWRYDFRANFGATRLQTIGAARALDLIVAFADAVAAKAGVIHWTVTASFASTLSSGAYSYDLTREQNDKTSDAHYFSSKWGQVIRGPSWGTFLSAAHVATLGGLPRIEADSGCARVVGLASGGAFLQATPIDQPIVEEHLDVDYDPLAPLARFLAPVMPGPKKPRA